MSLPALKKQLQDCRANLLQLQQELAALDTTIKRTAKTAFSFYLVIKPWTQARAASQ